LHNHFLEFLNIHQFLVYNTTMPTLEYPHLQTRSDGVLVVAESGLKVRMLVETYLSTKLSAAAVQETYPQLTMGQVHSVLAYYWDNKAALDAEIAQGQTLLEQTKQRFAGQPTRAELEARLTKR
jgi:uncharacterized protein (DUF433 family)